MTKISILFGSVSIAIFAVVFIYHDSNNSKKEYSPRVTLRKKSDGTTIFMSSPLERIFTDRNGGIVFPLSELDAVEQAKATTDSNLQGEYIVISACDCDLAEIEIRGGNSSGLIYLRGDFSKAVNRLKAAGVKEVVVSEVPYSRSDIDKYLKE
jgi:hypothetical protein